MKSLPKTHFPVSVYKPYTGLRSSQGIASKARRRDHGECPQNGLFSQRLYAIHWPPRCPRHRFQGASSGPWRVSPKRTFQSGKPILFISCPIPPIQRTESSVYTPYTGLRGAQGIASKARRRDHGECPQNGLFSQKAVFIRHTLASEVPKASLSRRVVGTMRVSPKRTFQSVCIVIARTVVGAKVSRSLTWPSYPSLLLTPCTLPPLPKTSGFSDVES
ncbi:hypothetical protein C8R47DRAFT_726065 [Mycena vitilis]|nr:hypothetical protein C8R47DRAFT_726065 [Mycena vitilis]